MKEVSPGRILAGSCSWRTHCSGFPQILFVTVGTDSQALALLRGIMGPYSPLIAALIVRLIVG